MLIGDGLYSLKLSELDYTIWRNITDSIAIKLGTIEGDTILEIRTPSCTKRGFDLITIEMPASKSMEDK